MNKKNVLFICVHNSARSQMAEAWLDYVCGEFFHAESAGLEPGKINPLVVQVMAEVGIDLSRKSTQAVFEQEKLSEIRKIRNEIRTKVEEWCEEVCPQALAPTQT